MNYHQTNKNVIREFLRIADEHGPVVSDETLCSLVDDARAGGVPYNEIGCCFITRCCGSIQAYLALRRKDHWLHPVDRAYLAFGGATSDEALRQRRLIPLLLSEISRRGAMVARRSHKPEVASSSLAAATSSREAVEVQR